MEIKAYPNHLGNYVDFEVWHYNKVVGRAYLYLIHNGLHDVPYGLIEDVHIDKEYRGKGVGHKLVKKMIDVAKEYDCYKIIATSRFSRESVHTFYEDLGLKQYGYEFRMDLE
jgi:GNAT superfamily N-acetyltransferase